jgi:hypothetical protein
MATDSRPSRSHGNSCSYSGYLVPTNSDISVLDVLFVGGFDEEAIQI